ncbi:20276_t:CDS:1, partial [Racocetra persica]
MFNFINYVYVNYIFESNDDLLFDYLSFIKNIIFVLYNSSNLPEDYDEESYYAIMRTIINKLQKFDKVVIINRSVKEDFWFVKELREKIDDTTIIHLIDVESNISYDGVNLLDKSNFVNEIYLKNIDCSLLKEMRIENRVQHLKLKNCKNLKLGLDDLKLLNKLMIDSTWIR